MTNEITWGDTVLVRSDAPAQFQPGTRGSISGFRDLGPESMPTRADVEQQARLYLVEFPDGKAIEIPEVFLDKVND